MLKLRLAGDRLCGRWLLTWLSLVMSLLMSLCAVLFPRDVLDGILNLIGSVSEGFSSYFWKGEGCRASPKCFWSSLINLISKDT